MLKIFSGVIFLSLFFLASCNMNETSTSLDESGSRDDISLQKASGSSANGQGRIAGTDRVFAFNAVTKPDGNTTG